MVYNIEKMLKDAGDKVQAADKTEVEAALADAKKTLEGTPSCGGAEGCAREADAGKPQAGRGDVQGERGCRPAAAATDGAAAGGTPSDEQKKDEGVIDAEYVDVEDKK